MTKFVLRLTYSGQCCNYNINSFVCVAVKLRNTKDVLIASHVQKRTSCISCIWTL